MILNERGAESGTFALNVLALIECFQEVCQKINLSIKSLDLALILIGIYLSPTARESNLA